MVLDARTMVDLVKNVVYQILVRNKLDIVNGYDMCNRLNGRYVSNDNFCEIIHIQGC